MAHSIQAVEGRVEILNDLDILASITLAIETASQNRGKYRAMQPFIADWQNACASYGPGTFDLRLNEIVQNQTARTELVALLVEVEGSLEELGDPVSGLMLTNSCLAPGVTFFDYPREKIKKTLRTICDLVH